MAQDPDCPPGLAAGVEGIVACLTAAEAEAEAGAELEAREVANGAWYMFSSR